MTKLQAQIDAPQPAWHAHRQRCLPSLIDALARWWCNSAAVCKSRSSRATRKAWKRQRPLNFKRLKSRLPVWVCISRAWMQTCTCPRCSKASSAHAHGWHSAWEAVEVKRSQKPKRLPRGPTASWAAGRARLGIWRQREAIRTWFASRSALGHAYTAARVCGGMQATVVLARQ